MNFHQAPIEDVIDLRRFAIGLSETTWRDRATQALLARTDELITRPKYQPLCLELCEHLISPAVQQYDRAMTLYARLQERTPEGTPIRQETMVLAGELLLCCLGQPDAALGLLNQARWEKARNTTWTARHGLARAEALLALGRMDDLAEQMRQLHQIRGQPGSPRQELRHAGLLRQAQGLARPPRDGGSENDPTSLNAAMDDLQTVLYEDPSQILSPSLNLIRLDIHLARGEYRIAQHLAERLAKLDLSPYDRAEVLVRHVQALCALGNLTSAGQILEDLAEAYPNSEQTFKARALLAEAAASVRRQ